MNIHSLLKYAEKPSVYADGTHVMWTDDYISKQLLQAHINPNNDVASRSHDKITLITHWINDLLGKENMRILDLGCGPGLYAEKFAEMGHTVTGVDFSKASIEYAKEQSKNKHNRNEYICQDYLNIAYEDQFDLVVLIYLDFCVLKPAERTKVVEKIYWSLKKGGCFVFDVVNSKNIKDKIIGQSWEISEKGFWMDRPYIALNNGYYFSEQKVLLNQHIIVDSDDRIKQYLFWSTCYEKDDLYPIMRDAGFHRLNKYENILPDSDAWNGENVDFYVAIK